jgi:HEPN domain-containing protein
MSSSDPRSWLEHARSDVVAARRLLPLLQGAYFIQQAAEKAIKSRLVRLGLSYPRRGGSGHDLLALTALLPDRDPMKSAFAEISTITPWATAFRYPSDDPATQASLTVQEMEFRLQQVETAIQRLSNLLGD